MKAKTFKDFCDLIEERGYEVRVRYVGVETKSESLMKTCRDQEISSLDIRDGEKYIGWLIANPHGDSPSWVLDHGENPDMNLLLEPFTEDQ
jgi:hypothetical protein